MLTVLSAYSAGCLQCWVLSAGCFSAACFSAGCLVPRAWCVVRGAQHEAPGTKHRARSAKHQAFRIHSPHANAAPDCALFGRARGRVFPGRGTARTGRYRVAGAGRSDGRGAPAPRRPGSPDVGRACFGLARLRRSPNQQSRRTEGAPVDRQWVEDLGVTPAGPSGYLEPFSFTHQSIRGLVTPGRPFRTTYRMQRTCWAPSAGHRVLQKTIVISAHYDHLGVRDGVTYSGRRRQRLGRRHAPSRSQRIHRRTPGPSAGLRGLRRGGARLRGAGNIRGRQD